jgi:hypothetical protein
MGQLCGSSLADNSGGSGFFQRNGLGKIPRRIPPGEPDTLKNNWHDSIHHGHWRT